MDPAASIQALIDEAATADDTRLFNLVVDVAVLSGQVGAADGVTAMQAITPYAAGFAARNPGNLDMRYRYAWILVVLSQRLEAAGRHDDSVQPARDAIAGFLGLGPDTPAGLAFDMLVQVAVISGQLPPAEAATALRGLVPVAERLVAGDPANAEYQYRYAWTLVVLSQRLEAAGQHDESVPPARAAIARFLQFAPAASDALIFEMIVQVAVISGQLPVAEGVEAIRAMLPSAAALAARNPGNIDYQGRFAWALVVFAQRLEASGQHAEAQPPAREAVRRHLAIAPAAPDALLAELITEVAVVSGLLPPVEALRAVLDLLPFAEQLAARNPAYQGLLDWLRLVIEQRRAAAGAGGEPEPPVGVQPAVFRGGAPVAALSRTPNQMDLFAVAADGAVRSAWWNGQWHDDWFRIGTRGFGPGTPIAVNSRNPDQMDLFAVGEDGGVYSAWWHGEWQDWFRIGTRTFAPGTPIAVLSRNPDQMDIFAVGDDGGLWSAWWHGEWHDWFRIGTRTFSQDTPIAVDSRNPDQMDIFAVGEDGGVWSAWWHGDWQDWFRVGTRTFSQGTPLAVNSRNPDQMDVFAVGDDGGVYSAWWHGEWQDWFRIGTRTFGQGTPLALNSRNPDQMDLFAAGDDGGVYSAWWHGDWHDWFRVGTRTFAQRAALAVLSRNPDQMDVFAAGDDGGVWSAWWHGDWHDWFRIGDAQPALIFGGPIASEGLAALGGWVEARIFPDGTSRWRGHAHDSGLDGYAFGVSATISNRAGRVLAFSHHGHVEGTLSTEGGRDEDWDEFRPADPVIAQYFRTFAAAEVAIPVSYSSDIGTFVVDVVDFIVTWELGASPVGAVVGLVAFIGVEVGSLFATGSLVPGARIIGSSLWMAGPTNTLLSIAAEGLASFGSESRSLTPEEYDWADSTVFGGTLPPREDILLTDIIGKDDRPFTMPGSGDWIYLNMGREAFADPRKFGLARGKQYGETFVHELTHAWQIAHTPMQLSLIAGVLGNQLRHDPYEYGPPGASFSEFNLEQQAAIVADWFVGNQRPGSTQTSTDMDPASPYFRYIQQNIRQGQY